MKHVREFTLPRERTTPEITRAFQLIQVSLQNLERAVNTPSDDSAVTALRADVEKLERIVLRPQPQQVKVVRPDIVYAKEL